ncbi:MAG: DNA helicase, partial [Proteobacteria bacterium]
MAALNVVHRRLEEKGIAEFCLEVHSNKTSKMEILQQLDRAWNASGNLSQAEWSRETDRLRTLRDRLNEVCEKLHLRHPNGMTVHQAVGLVARDHGSSTPKLGWTLGTVHTSQQLDSMRETARRMDLSFDDYSESPKDFSIIEQEEWSNSWQEAVLCIAKKLPTVIAQLVSSNEQLTKVCQFDLPTGSVSEMERLVKLLRVILTTHKKNMSFAFAPDLTKKVEAARRVLSLLEKYQRGQRKLSISYSVDAVRKIDVDQLDSDWSTASKKFWLLGKMAMKGVAKTLGAQAGSNTLPDVESDSPTLRELKGLLSEMDELKSCLANVPGYAGLDSKTAVIEESVKIAEAL